MLCKTTPAVNYLFQGKPHSESQGALILPSPWLLWTVHVLYLVYKKNRCWPTGGFMCRVLTWILIQASPQPYGMAIITAIFSQAQEIQRSDRSMAELGLRRWSPGDDPSLLDCILSLHWLLHCGHREGHMLDFYVGQVASFKKSELKTHPPFGMDNGAKIFLCNSQDIWWLNSLQGPAAWMPQSTQPRVQLAGRTLHASVFSFSWLSGSLSAGRDNAVFCVMHIQAPYSVCSKAFDSFQGSDAYNRNDDDGPHSGAAIISTLPSVRADHHVRCMLRQRNVTRLSSP